MLAYLLALMLISSPVSEKVETAVKAYVENNFPIENSEYQYDFHRVNWNTLPTEIDSVQVFRIGKDSPLGNTIFTLGCYKGGNLAKAVPVSIGVSMLVDVLVTTMPINVGEDVRGLMPARRSITGKGEMPLTDSTYLEGKIATRYIPAGSIIYGSLVEQKPVVNPGDKVNIIFETGALKVTAEGVARQKGGVGETIRVVNLGSKKVIQAMIIDSLTVAVK